MKPIRLVARLITVVALLAQWLFGSSMPLAKPPPGLQVSPDSLRFETQVNGSNPRFQRLTLVNNEDKVVRWQASTDVSWITLGAPEGAMAAGQTIHLLVLANAQGMPVGTHQGTITIEERDAQDSPALIAVQLSVTRELQLSDFNACDKQAPPVTGWGSFTDGDRGKAFESCGVAVKDPQDRNQVMWLSYDVSAIGSYAGFWLTFQMPDFDPATVEALRFFVRGNQDLGFEQRLKVELKLHEGSFGWKHFELNTITQAWQRVTIPLRDFRLNEPWTQTDVFVIAFDQDSRVKRGGIVIDDLSFVLKEK